MLTLDYIGGFFDGEGSIGVYKNSRGKRGYYLQIQLVQNNGPVARAIFDEVAARFGGSVGKRITLRSSAVTWQLVADKGCAFLEAMLPHLVLKRAQAAVAIEWWRGRPRQQRRPVGRGWLPRDDEETSAAVSAKLKEMKKFVPMEAS